jgi:hypothetical protein
MESTQIRWFFEQSDRRLGLKRGSQRHSKVSYLKGEAIRLKSARIRWFS